MKYFLLLNTLFLMSLSVWSQGQKRCDFDNYFNHLNSSREFRMKVSEFEANLKKVSHSKTETVFLIPVVVHVIYNTAQQNISDGQIISQLEVLNKDFRKRNADTSLVDPDFSVADSRIEFCLARRDPNGNETTGINRIPTNLSEIGTNDQYYQIQPAWNPDQYLNIWVGRYGTDNQNNEILGKASPPTEPNANKDGVIITTNAFGTIGTAASPYDEGRTASHEIGHWLGLYHTWGINVASCADDDQVQDTPNQGQIYYGCLTLERSSCGSKDMLSNFMGYIDDACMGNFTNGQKDRMRNTIVLQRPSLLLSRGCLPVGLDERSSKLDLNIYPIPANDQLILDLKDQKIEDLQIHLYSSNGALMKSQSFEVNRPLIKINTAELDNGIYLIRVSSAEGESTSKIIVQH